MVPKVSDERAAGHIADAVVLHQRLLGDLLGRVLFDLCVLFDICVLFDLWRVELCRGIACIVLDAREAVVFNELL